mgnify:CR=1 FL=1
MRDLALDDEAAADRYLASAGRRKWERFLHAHKLYRPETAQRRLAAFADALTFASPNPAVTRAKALLAVAMAKQLCLLQSQLDVYRARIVDLFDDHPDHDCFGSLPGAGPKIAPRLLSELGGNREVFATADRLRDGGEYSVEVVAADPDVVRLRRADRRDAARLSQLSARQPAGESRSRDDAGRAARPTIGALTSKSGVND